MSKLWETGNRRKSLARKAFSWLMVLCMVFSTGAFTVQTANAATGDTPPHTKNITNNGDGTYTISLDIVGESEKKPNNVNVIVIFDRSGSMTTQRMNAAKSAVNNLANALFAYNSSSAPNTVQMALVSFSNTATITRQPTNSYQQFSSSVNGLSADGGTNWEDALEEAGNVNFGDEDQTFVIFVSDGNPTFRNTMGTTRITDNYWYNNDDIYYSQLGVYGLGSDNPNNRNYSPQSMTYCYNHAVDNAQDLVGDVGADHFFTIGAFGNADRMKDLTDDAGSDSTTNYYRADDTAALNTAISDILAKIETMGIASAEVDDGTTNQVTTSSGPISLLELVPNFKYYRSGGSYGSSLQEWSGAPEAKIVDGEVQWDLSSVGVLENGVKYTVTFDCYPSQTTYDIIAQLKNGDLQYSQLDSEIQKYIVDNGGGSYSLRTNTNAGIKWDDTRDEAGRQESSYRNPDPVKTDAETLTATKEWEGGDPDVKQLEITVLMDDEPFHSATISGDNDWSTESFISIGIIKNGQALPGAEGHDFKFAELGDEQYHWELESPVVHPMLVDGTKTMLIMVDDKHPAPPGAKTYTIDNKTYYADTSAAGLTAINHRRSNLNLTKVVTGEDAPKDAKFPFELTVINSKAPATAPSAEDDPDHNSDYWVWLSIRNEKNQGVTGLDMGDDVVEDSGGYYYAPSGTTFSLEIGAGWSLRFLNLPTGSTYTFSEDLSELDGFAFSSAELTQGEDSTFEGDQTTTGTIENTKTSYSVKYTNDYALTDLEITKVWNDASDQDGLRPDTLALTLNGAPDGTTVPEPLIEPSEDGNTWTYTWKGLPRFDAQGNEIAYTVTEEDVPKGYECSGSPAADGGTITNTHEPEVVDVKVVKEWAGDDFQGNIRPKQIQAQLKADGTASGDPVTLNDGNKWTYTWEDQPKYKDGEEIVYTADETAVPAGYDKSGPEKSVAEDGTITFTVKNTYNPTPVSVDPPVQKIIQNKSDLYNKGDFTFTIENTESPEGVTAPMPKNTSITNSSEYELEGKTGFYEFGEITFDMPGTYTYKVTESGEVKGVTNDPAAAEGKTVTFTVTDNGTGKLKVTPTTDEVQLSFTNVYNASGEASIVVNKAITGAAWPEDAELTFTIAGTGNAPMPEETTATLDAEGTVTFGPIKYALSDAGKEYTYTITEDGFGKGWTGSGDVTAKVAVSDKGDGTLTADVTYTPEDATITNTYKAKGDATIEVTKAVAGADWPEGKTLTLTLTGKNEAPMPAEGGETVTLTEAGKATFGKIEYDESDIGKTYEYTVSEDGFGDGWTGSGDVTATVEVTDNGDGTLATKVSYSNMSSIINTYTAAGNAVIEVNKEVTGAAWPEDAELTLTLEGEEGAPMPAEGGETVTLTEAGKATFGTIEYDESDVGKTYTYTITEDGFGDGWTGSPESITATVTVTDNGDGTLDAEVTYEPETQKFVNKYEAEGEATIEVTKALVGADWPEGKSLTLTLAGKDGAPMPEEGKETVTLKAAGKATFGTIAYDESDIDKTYEYTITEDGFGKGWEGTPASITATVKVTDNGNGTLATEVTYDPEEALFTNTYSATGSVTLEATKELKGRDWKDSDEFVFELTGKDGVIDAQTVTKGNENVTFKTINYTLEDVGTHTYTISEKQDGLPAGVTQTSDDIEVEVTVVDNHDGTLTATPVYKPNTKTITNTYKAAPVDAHIDVTKTIEGYVDESMGYSQASDSTFEFTLCDEDGKPIEGIDPITITTQGGKGGKESFADITYDKAGTYNYIVKETKGDAAGYTYSDKEYPVTVTVTDNTDEGKLEAEISYGEAAEGEEAPTSVEVENQFKFESATVTLELTKTIEDLSDSATDHTFNFKLYKDSVSEENYVEEKSITTENLTGSVDFSELTFDKPGTYTYVVVEEEGEVNGMTYDTTEQTYQIIVDDNFDTAILEINEDSTTSVEIVNEYKAKATSTILKVTKEIEDTSGSAYDTEFTFTLKDKDGETIDTKSITGPGEVAFEEIEYEKAGTYEYTIQETAGGAAGWKYDTAEYKVTVTVEDVDGALQATAAYMDKQSGGSKTELTITNTYDPDDATIVLKAKKVIEDKTGGASGKTFKFELLDADGNVVATATRKGSGSISFKELSFDKVGTYNYTIREVKGSDKGYTYDTNEYPVTVEVTDDGDGLLVAKVTEGEDVVITNTYEAKPVTLVLEATKVLTGRDLEDGEFTFQLKDGDEVIAEATNDADGKIVFDELTFEKAGTYKYLMLEVIGDEENMTYDTNVYPVTVEVTDDGEGELKAECKDEITFNNKYKEPPVPPEPKPEPTPKTGDDSMDTVAILVLFASATLLGLLRARRRSNER